MENTVITFDGTSANRTECRYISGQYFKMGTQCFLMNDGVWYRIISPRIIYDEETGVASFVDSSEEAVASSDNNSPVEDAQTSTSFISRESVAQMLRASIIAEMDPIDEISRPMLERVEEELKPSIRYDFFKHIKATDGTVFESEEEAISNGYEECYSDGFFYPKGQTSNPKRKGIANGYNKFKMYYSAGPNINTFSNVFSNYFEPSEVLSDRLKEEFGDFTFGVEFETSNGFIPERKAMKLGLIPLIDGSLRHDGVCPFEYTTIPLSAKSNGLEAILDSCKTLQKYNEISHKCALHVHIGNIPLSKDYIVAMYNIIIGIQDEIYKMFPYNYRYTSDNNFKSKDYCSPIKDILKFDGVNSDFNNILSLLGCDPSDYRGFGEGNHPDDQDGTRKWNIPYRYKGVNLIPTLWGSAKTTEFRMHNPTIDENKVINWLFICNGIFKFALKNKKSLSKCKVDITLRNILEDVYSEELALILSDYIDERKVVMEELFNKGDLIGDAELTNKEECVSLNKFSILNIK